MAEEAEAAAAAEAVGSAAAVLVEVADLAEAELLVPAVGFLEVVEHDPPLGVRLHSAVPVAEQQAVRDRRLRVLDRALAVPLDRMPEAEMLAAQIDLRRSLDRDRTSALALAIVLRRCRALGQVQARELDRARGSPIVPVPERAKELPIGPASHSDRLNCRDSAVARLARVCRIKGPAFKTARRTVRSRFKIDRAA